MLGSNQRPLPCEGSKIVCWRFLEIAEYLQITEFPRWRISRHFRRFTRVAARLLHNHCALVLLQDSLTNTCRNNLAGGRSLFVRITQVHLQPTGASKVGPAHCSRPLFLPLFTNDVEQAFSEVPA